MLDKYTIGKAKRISPEAPVAVVSVTKEEVRPGGAGNVTLNLVSLGAQVIMIGRVGNDNSGDQLTKILSDEGVDVRGIVRQENLITPVKNRIIAENQQVVRVDFESIVPLPEMLEQQMIEMLPELFVGVEVVAISDYGKGLLTRTLLAAIIEHARKMGISVIADPKGIEFSKYAGATILKPNKTEAYAAANLPLDTPIDFVAARILQTCDIQVLMITRSEEGISLFHRDGHVEDFPVSKREVRDVTGAGDTVLAVQACALANQLSLAEAVQLSNIAAGIAIEHFGCARVTLAELARRLLESNVVNKIFDEDHLFAVQHALAGRKWRFLSISSMLGLTSKIFTTIKQLASTEDWDLVVYVREQDPDPEFISILATLSDIDFIILKNQSLHHFTSNLQPNEIFTLDEQNGLLSLANFDLLDLMPVV